MSRVTRLKQRSLFDFGGARTANPSARVNPSARTAEAIWVRHGNPTKQAAAGRIPNFVPRGADPGKELADLVVRDSKDASTIVIRGDEVSFLDSETGTETVLPDDFLVVHDVSGKILRQCDLYFLRNRGVVHDDTPFTTEAVTALHKWYGDGRFHRQISR